MAEAKTKPKAGKKILIVEDEKPLAHALQLKFTNEGYDVTLAEDGQVGLSSARSQKFDLILLDLIMPHMDGFSFLEEMGKKKVPIIVLSNLSQGEDRTRAESLGAAGYYVKSNTPIIKIITAAKSVL